MGNDIQPELKDVLEMLHRYTAANRNNACIIFNVVGFKKDLKNKCVDCGDDCDIINEKASELGAYGDLETLRLMVNDLRDLIEDECDSEGFVNC